MLHGNERIIKHKAGLLSLAEKIGNTPKAWQMMGLSRKIFCRHKSAGEEDEVNDLTDEIC